MFHRLQDLPEDLRARVVAMGRTGAAEGFMVTRQKGRRAGLWRVLLGGLILVLQGLYFSHQFWVLDLRGVLVVTVVSSLAALLAVPALVDNLGYLLSRTRPVSIINRVFVAYTERDGWVEVRPHEKPELWDEKEHLNDEDWPARLAAAGVRGLEARPRPGMLGRLAGWLLMLVLSLATGIGAALWGRVGNLRYAEASRWEGIAPDRLESWQDYVRWGEGRHLGLWEQAHDLAASERAVVETLEASRRSRRQEELLERHEAALRSHREAIRERLPFLVERFTPLLAHVAEARERVDDLRYQAALEAGTATALREYREDHPAGRHLLEAREALRDLYRAAEARYVEGIEASGADPRAAAGVRALLGYLRDRDVEVPVVSVCFLPVEGLEGGAVEEQVRRLTGSSKVHPVGPSFTAEANQAREGSIVARMDQALRRVVGDLFRLQAGALEGSRSRPRFLVRYRVRGTGVPYSRVAEEGLRPSERNYYVGIALDLDFTVQVPAGEERLPDDPARGFRFSISASPAPNFSAGQEGWAEEALARVVYDTMVRTAFDELARNLARGYGLAGRGT